MKKLVVLFAALALQFGYATQVQAETRTLTFIEEVRNDDGSVTKTTTVVTYENGKKVSEKTTTTTTTVTLKVFTEPELASRGN